MMLATYVLRPRLRRVNIECAQFKYYEVIKSYQTEAKYPALA